MEIEIRKSAGRYGTCDIHDISSGITLASQTLACTETRQPRFHDIDGSHAVTSSRHLQEQRENAGISIDPVVRNLAITKESNQRKISERLPDHADFFGLLSKKIRTAGDTGIVQAASRTPEQSAADAIKHACHVLGRAGFVAAAEHDLRAGLR